jgi:hypothetical protein
MRWYRPRSGVEDTMMIAVYQGEDGNDKERLRAYYNG